MILYPGPDIAVDPVVTSIDGFQTGMPDEFGTRITLALEDGWYGSPGMRRPSRADRPNQHGAFGSQGFSEGRSIQLDGNGFCETTELGMKSIRALRAVLAHGGPGSL